MNKYSDHLSKEKIGEMLGNARRDKGYTQQELSLLTGISLRSVQRIEGGKVMPRAYTLNVLFSFLNIRLEHGDAPKEAFQEGDAKAFTAGQNLRILNLIWSVGIALLFFLLSAAYLSQAKRFPETSFEMFLFWAAVVALYMIILVIIWRQRTVDF